MLFTLYYITITFKLLFYLTKKKQKSKNSKNYQRKMNIEKQVKVNNEIKKEKINKGKLISHIESKYLNNNQPKGINIKEIAPGDILKIGYRIQEGEKERLQFTQGLVIAKQNRSLSKTFTLRRNVQGIGLEQVFFCHSPLIESIERKQESKVRRSKLYFIRNLRGKAARLKVK